MRLSRDKIEEIKASRERIYLKARTLVSLKGTENDVERLFQLYDDEFFNGQITDRVVELAKARKMPKAYTPKVIPKAYTVNPKIQFLATPRTSGYGSLSGFYFEPTFNKQTERYDYQKVFFLDICPNLLETIFRVSKGKGLPFAAGIGCDEQLKCFMLVMEHEIIHLLMSLWNFGSPEQLQENFLLYGPHGRLFNCMLETYFGHTQRNHNLSLEGVYVPSFALDSETPKEVGAGFNNWSASCYLDSVLTIMLETQSNFWRHTIFDWKPENNQSINPDLAKQVQTALLEDYEALHKPETETVECVNLRELLAVQDPLMKRSSGGWKMYEPGSTYATFVQLFPNLAIDAPVRMIRPEIEEVESIKYKTNAAFTFSDFMIGPTPEDDEDYQEILWDEIQSPALIFTHQGAPPIKIFDSLEDEDKLEYEKVRAFGPKIINDRYKLTGVVVLHGRITKTGGGGHYTCYFLAKDGQWYHYNDLGPSFELIGKVEDLPRKGIWEQSSQLLPTMYFYVLDKGRKGLEGGPGVQTVSKVEEKKEVFRNKDFDYVRVDRPDGGVIFVVEFKNQTVKATVLKAIADLKRSETTVVETKVSEHKIAWRVPSESSSVGNTLHKLLKDAASTKTPATPKKESDLLFKNKKYSVYDYSDKAVAVIGPKIPELESMGLESKKLKFNLGQGFIISKTKLKKLKELLNL